MLKKFLYTILIFVGLSGAYLSAQSCDTSKFSAMIKKSRALNTTKPYSALKLALTTLELTKKCGNLFWIGKSYLQMGSSYDYLTKVDSAFYGFQMYLYYANRLKDTSCIADAYNNMGALYIYKANYSAALKLCIKALSLAEKINDERVAAACYGNIGNVYYFQKQYDNALEYWLRCLAVQKKLNNYQNVIVLLSNISAYYNEKEDFKTSIRYLNECLSYTQKNKDVRGEMIAYVNLGASLSYDGDNKTALEYFFKAREIAIDLNDNYNLITTLNDMADCYHRLQNYKLAIDYYFQSLEIERKNSNPEGKIAAYLGLYMVYDSTANYKKAIYYLRRMQELKDSVLNIENQKQINELQTQYQSEKKDQENKLLTAKNTLSEQTIKNQNRFAIFLVVGIIISLLLTLNVYRSYRQKKKDNMIILSQKDEVELRNDIISKQKSVVEEKQREVLDSIHYAKRIQQSLLTSEKNIEKMLNNLRKK